MGEMLWLFGSLAITALALFAVCTAVEVVAPGAILALVDRLGFGDEPEWRK